MGKTKQIFTRARVILLLVFLLFALVAINPNPWKEGVAIRTVAKNSSASIAGIASPKPTSTLMSREVIVSMNNRPVKNIEEYKAIISTLEANRTLMIKTSKGNYKIVTKPKIEITVLNETEKKVITEVVQENITVNGTLVLSNRTVTRTEIVPKTTSKEVGMEDIGLSVYNAPKNNIIKGLDLQGGTRVLLQPEKKVSTQDMETLIDNMKERLNVYGLTDISVKGTTDLSGNQFVVVEIAGANEEEVRELLAKQGKFEAVVANTTVFKGGGDITYVCRSAECAGIDPQQGCGMMADKSWACRFRFSIAMTPDAAQRQADATANLGVITENGDQYLTEQIHFYLDNSLVDSLNIGADLKGRASTEISISGSGVGRTREEATYDSLKNMKRLQTILITGSLPVSVEIVKTDAISPVLGEQFTKNALFIGVLAVITVSAVIFIRYRKLEISIPVIITMVSEVVLLLGLAALVRWNLDIAAIAGIIVSAGTGANQQIIIADEILRGESNTAFNWREKIKNAFFIIFGSCSTVIVAMIPLLFAGAGLLKGFAFVTIAGVSFGVLIARPAFAAVIEILLKK